MKLTNIILPDLGRNELRIGARTINFESPVDSVLGWRVLVRGPAVILLSPKGQGYEFARSACVLAWDSAKPEDYDKLVNYTSEPLARKPLAEVVDEVVESAPAAKAGAR